MRTNSIYFILMEARKNKRKISNIFRKSNGFQNNIDSNRNEGYEAVLKKIKE